MVASLPPASGHQQAAGACIRVSYPKRSGQCYLPVPEQDAHRAYANENWGRKFYVTLSPLVIDSEGHTWVDPVSGGWGDPGISPHDKLRTDDAR